MKPSERIVWREGMLMLPHHMQQGDRFHEENLRRGLRTLSSYGWGVGRVEMDTAALSTGMIRVASLEAMMPSGIAVSIGGATTGRSELSRPFIPANGVSETGVFIGLGATSEQQSLAEGSGRFAYEMRTVRDAVSGGDEQNIEVARPLPKLLFQGEDFEGLEVIEIARVRSTSAGLPVFVEDFIPACTRISASPFLAKRTRDMVARIRAKRTVLHRAITSSVSTDRRGYLGSELPSLLCLRSISSSLPIFEHLLVAGRPEDLFLELSRMRGELAVFSPSAEIAPVLPYDHAQLGPMFRELFSEVDELLSIGSLAAAYPIALAYEQAGLLSGEISPREVLDEGALFLLVSGEASARALASSTSRFERVVKIGSRDQIRQIVRSAMPGVRVEPESNPPSVLQVIDGAHVFRVQQVGPFWDQIRQSASLGIHLPGPLSSCSVELWGVVEAQA